MTDLDLVDKRISFLTNVLDDFRGDINDLYSKIEKHDEVLHAMCKRTDLLHTALQEHRTNASIRTAQQQGDMQILHDRLANIENYHQNFLMADGRLEVLIDQLNIRLKALESKGDMSSLIKTIDELLPAYIESLAVRIKDLETIIATDTIQERLSTEIILRKDLRDFCFDVLEIRIKVLEEDRVSIYERLTKLEALVPVKTPSDSLDTYLEYDELDKRMTHLEETALSTLLTRLTKLENSIPDILTDFEARLIKLESRDRALNLDHRLYQLESVHSSDSVLTANMRLTHLEELLASSGLFKDKVFGQGDKK